MPFNFDDAANIVNRPIIREFNLPGVMKALKGHRGLAVVSFQLNYYLSGVNVTSYHLLNLLIHLATAILVYCFLALLLKTPCLRRDPGSEPLPVPFFTALVFAVHPLQTQAVTYVVQRFTALATLWYVAGAICYLQARLGQVRQNRLVSAGIVAWFAGCGAALFCAVKSKEIAYTLPLALLLIEFLCFKVNRKKICAIIALAALGVAALVLRLVLGTVPIEQALSVMDEATRLQTITSRSEYLFTQFRVILTYVRLLLLPVNQRVDYDYSLSHSFFEPAVVGSFFALALLLGVAVILVKRSRAGNTDQRLIALGIFWFFLTLSIESSVFPIIDLIFEHRLYLPSVGAIAALTTAGLSVAWRRESERARGGVCIALLLIAVVLAGAAWKRNLVWSSEVALWEDATEKSPESSRAWNNLGSAHIKERAADKALKALVRAIELDRGKREAWNNLGIAIDLKGVYRERFNRTTEMFTSPESIRDEVIDRWQGDVNNNLGLAYEILGNYSKAAENYRNAIGYAPSLTLAYYNLGIVSAVTGDYETLAAQQQVLMLLDPVLAERLAQRVGGR